MFEHRHQPLLPRRAYLRRVATNTAFALGIIAASLSLGILGYHEIEGFAWIDSLLNASMLLGGMGPVGEMHTNAGKIFASFYALFSGLVLITVTGVLFAPFIHRFLHRFHIGSDMDDARKSKTRS